MTQLRLQAVPAIRRGVKVAVQSWHSQTGRVVKGIAGQDGGVTATLLRANLTDDVASGLAAKLQAEIGAHGRTISMRMPGELTLTPRNTIRLDGDVAGWSGVYQITDLSRHLGPKVGFTQSITASRIN